MNKFEAVILLSPDLTSDLIANEDNGFAEIIEKNNGKIISKEDWGIKNLSYNIQNYKKAFYIFYQIEANGSIFHSIKKNLTQNEKILRHLFVKVEDHQQLPTKMIDNEEK